jgi:hypothetical protein
MAVYSPPEQILFSPNRSYQQGKALRADTALREKQAKALQMEMDAAPAKAAAAQREEQDRDVEESLRELGEARTDDLAEASASGFLAFDEGATDEEATERFFAPLYASPNFTPEQVDQIRSSLDKDGNAVISKKEAESLKNFGMAYALRKEQQKKIVGKSNRRKSLKVTRTAGAVQAVCLQNQALKTLRQNLYRSTEKQQIPLILFPGPRRKNYLKGTSGCGTLWSLVPPKKRLLIL